MKYKVRKGIKINSEEGDSTPNNTPIIILGEVPLPSEVRREGVEAGLRDTEKMYLAYLDKEFRPHMSMFIVNWKVQLEEEYSELEIEDEESQELSEAMERIKEMGFVSYSE